MPLISGDLIVFYTYSREVSKYYVFNTKNSTLCSKEFSYEDVCRLKKISDEGVVFFTNDEETKTVFFESFTKEELK